MTFKAFTLMSAALLLSAPMFAGTYFGGFEDMSRQSDNDYNDLVFSLSGSGLTLHTSDGAWFNQPTLGTNGNPFWNHQSYDGSNYNVGYCIYGGGSCNGGVALDPGARYLAKAGNPGQVANNVYFSANGTVSTDIALTITSATDIFGWYSLSNPNNIHWLNASGQTGVFSFNAYGDFGIAANTGANASGDTFYSSQIGCDPSDSHFAFFGNNVSAAPEPGALGLMAVGLITAGVLFRRKRSVIN